MKFNSENRKAIMGTLLFHAVALCLLLFLALRTPLPLPEEEGVEVNLGYSENAGSGNHQRQQPAPAATQPSRERQQVAKVQKKTIEKVQTQEEEAPTLPVPKEKDLKPQPVPDNMEQADTEQSQSEPVAEKIPEPPQEEPQPVVNPALLYKGRAKDEQGESAEGQTNAVGDQGSLQGDPNAGNYQGVGGKGKNGIRYALGNRKAKALPKPDYTSKDQGVVVVSIWVDKTGVVRRAAKLQKGTTVTDQKLIRMAEQAAMQALFTPDNAALAELQKGSITYVFRKIN